MFMDGEEWPKRTDYSEKAWVESLNLLESVHDRLVDAIRGFNEKRIEDLVVMDGKWPEPWRSTTYYQLFHGMLHHLVYHTAQIAILIKGL